MIKYCKYLWYVIKHKWFVFIECYKLGIPWLGIIHDWSKFRPSEFIPYTRHFFGGRKSGIEKGRDSTGYYKPYDTGDKDFDFAWFLHQKRNKHHWQWWVFPLDKEGYKMLGMTQKYRKEMLADWKGAGRAQKTPGVEVWYQKNKDKLQLHPSTRLWIEGMLLE